MTINQTNRNAGDVNNVAGVDPMVPILTGWLAGAVLKDAGSLMKLFTVKVNPPASFDVTFASGLVLRVSVSEVAKAKEVT
jgi:hypothetical protein